MNRLVVLSLGSGKLQLGFESVTARIWQSDTEVSNPDSMQVISQVTGSLPPAPEIIELYAHWQLLYSILYKQLNPRIKVNDAGDIKSVSGVEFSDLCQGLKSSLNKWLDSEAFRKIDQQLSIHLSASEEIRFVIETNDNQARKLPWHLWSFFDNYTKAEVALSALEYQSTRKVLTKPSSSQVKILAILGNREGIAIEKDRAFLEQLSDTVDTKFLVEPQPEQLNDQLWEQGWDILFFAGHSSSQKQGQIQLNHANSLTLDKLKYALSKAIESGLQLAIFNSCDGLGLADTLASLHIPQVIVMREPVPDVVAQEFLKHFLAAFSGGQSLYGSVRSARERLERLELQYPCASWLPVICQNPAEPPTTWQKLCAPNSSDSPIVITGPKSSQNPPIKRRNRVLTALLASIAVAAGVMGIRHLGVMQTWELQAFDQLVRLRPEENPDPRILVITISENDITAQDPKFRRGSISDWALNRLLAILEQHQPRVVGLDIYRDPTPRPDLAVRLGSDERLIAVCKVRDTTVGDAGTPPPPEVPIERQGFSDFVKDSDGVVRRNLFYLTPDPASPCRAPYSFSMQVAFRYLLKEGIMPLPTPDGALQLGDAVFRPIEARTGGYQQIDAGGYQVLLNYRSPRSPQNVAAQVSLMQVLTGRFDPSSIKDRVVLIGTTAGSFQDYWLTPYGNGQKSARELPGVLLQAQMVSHILSAAKDRRPLLYSVPLWADFLWVLGCSLMGGILAWRIRSLLHLAVAICCVQVCLYGLSLILLLEIGFWVPLVPSAVVLAITSSSVAMYNTFQRKENIVSAS